MIDYERTFVKKGVFKKFAAIAGLAAIVPTFDASAIANTHVAGPVHLQGAKTFFTQFVTSGGPIVWFILIPMSVIALCVVIDLCVLIRRKRLLPRGIAANIRALANNLGNTQLPAKVSSGADLVSRAFVCAIGQSNQPVIDQGQLRHLAAESLHDQGLGLLRKAEWLNIIGTVAPMVGLFGTVFGMIKAFNLLGISGSQPRPDQLAAAISIALVTTFWGLLIAIPALAMFGIFRTRIETLVSEASIEVENLLRDVKAKTPPSKKTAGSIDISNLQRRIQMAKREDHGEKS